MGSVECVFGVKMFFRLIVQIFSVYVNQMSPEELNFYYFKMIDVDKNAKLDGLELVASIIHYSNHGHGDVKGHVDQHGDFKIFSDEDFAQQIDPVLRKDDLDKDGYISYPEFLIAQRQQVKVSVS